MSGRCEFFDEPYGIVSDPSGEQLYVALDYPGQVLTIDVHSLQLTETFQGNYFLRGIALSSKDGLAYVSEYYPSKVIAIHLAHGTIARP